MTDMPLFGTLSVGHDGLVPCVVQDAATRQVLMVGYQDEEAWEQTAESGLVHFHSRSRDVLWMKGETSGNTLAVTSVRIDCDRDTVLISAVPVGPTCHTGATSCFDGDEPPTLGAALDELMETIRIRTTADPSTSYTATLLADGDLAARKVLEEAGELAFASKDTAGGGSDERVVEEAADLLYHTLALIAQQGVTTERVAQELRSRRN
ncbi:MAG: bifunctional phosphoribosyl-AMP cyclohydrolase/phosphoribosyl-ATP diphosphatase HisIE [Actinomycetota bacterium]